LASGLDTSAGPLIIYKEAPARRAVTDNESPETMLPASRVPPYPWVSPYHLISMPYSAPLAGSHNAAAAVLLLNPCFYNYM
jgi:hypothetical protein